MRTLYLFPSLCLTLLFLFPAAGLRAGTTPDQGTTTFNSAFTSTGALAGPATNTVSTANAGNTGWDFAVLATGSTNVSIAVSAAGSNPGGASDFDIHMNSGSSSVTVVSANTKSDDASAFQLLSVQVKVNMPPSSTADITITGYRAGAAVSGATLTITGITTDNTLWHLFDVSSNPSFNNVDEFRITQAATTSAVVTFFGVDDIDIGPASTLPLNLIDFTGLRDDNQVRLQWTTASEENTAGFDVQRGTNGADFTTVGRVQAAGNSTQLQNYNYTDALPAAASPAYFYRLQMNDLDGRYTYSPVLRISSSASASLTAYPNPFREQLTMVVQATEAGKAQLTLTDMGGKILLKQDRPVQKGVNSFSLPSMASLGKGIYWLNITTPHGKQTLRVVKLVE